MGIAIYLRQNKNINYFRDIIINSINSGDGDSAILCSGFFQENFKGSPYQATLEGNLAICLKNNNIHLTTIGIHNNTWLNSYKNFVKSLQHYGVNVTPLYKGSLRWHAKVYILKNGSNPLLGIIGSSNITRNAFSVNTTFNYEADVVLWTDKSDKIINLMENSIKRVNNPNDVINLDYDPSKFGNGALTIEDRLINLEKELKSLKLKELDI